MSTTKTRTTERRPISLRAEIETIGLIEEFRTAQLAPPTFTAALKALVELGHGAWRRRQGDTDTPKGAG